MSMLLCSRCQALVDTDAHPEAYDEITDSWYCWDCLPSHDEGPWVRECWSCGASGNDWVTMTPQYLGKRPTGPVPVCSSCAQREIDHRIEKGE